MGLLCVGRICVGVSADMSVTTSEALDPPSPLHPCRRPEKEF